MWQVAVLWLVVKKPSSALSKGFFRDLDFGKVTVRHEILWYVQLRQKDDSTLKNINRDFWDQETFICCIFIFCSKWNSS